MMLEKRAFLRKEPKCNFNDFYYFPNAFTDEMIEKTHSMIYNGKYKFKKGKTGYGDNVDTKETNNRDIAYVPLQDDSEWIYEILFEIF